MIKVRILYVSIEGNTRNFIQRLKSFFKNYHDNYTVEGKEISDETEPKEEKIPFFIDVPTYLEGGTGTGPRVKEIFTNSLSEYLDYQKNYQKLIGIFGSGNQNFNVQFTLTAKRYAKKFNSPLLYKYEMLGTKKDVQKVGHIIVKYFSNLKTNK